MTGVVGLLILAAVVVAGIFVGVRQMRAVFARENTRLKCLVADVLAEIDCARWEKEIGTTK